MKYLNKKIILLMIFININSFKFIKENKIFCFINFLNLFQKIPIINIHIPKKSFIF